MTIKSDCLSRYVTQGCTFVETGTRWGDTAGRAFELGAETVWTIEADEELANISYRRLCDNFPHKKDNLNVLIGNSQERLAYVMDQIHTPAVFFLDAHTDKYSPLAEELAIIGRHRIKTHTILIDDIRVFAAGHWSPPPLEIVKRLRKINPDYDVYFEDGVSEADVMVAMVPM